jgi:hypothetical protein
LPPFAEKLKDAEIGERLIEELMGHRLTSLSMGRYGKPYKADVRLQAISMIQYRIIPELKEEELFDPASEQEQDYLTCGETRIRVYLDEGVEPRERLQYQRPDLHGYSPFHKEIESFLQD